MPKKLFVGGLSWNTGDAELKTAFESFGTVTQCKVVTHREGEHAGKSRGFGFVEFETDESAEKALALDNTELDGRSLRVNWANDKQRA